MVNALPDIFLSYTHDDRARAQLFAHAFEAEGFEVWWDVGIHTGEAYDQVTEKALRDARAVVVMWSKSSVASRWVRAEATLADRARTLMPCTIEACDRPIMFELIQTAGLEHWQGDNTDNAWVTFLADVRRMTEKARAEGATMPLRVQPVQPPAQKSGGRPSLAVLPFVNRSTEKADEVFAIGLVEDVVAALSLAQNAKILSQSSTAKYCRGGVDLSRIHKELDVRYALEGNVRRVGEALRVTAQLVEAATGNILWTRMFARPLAELALLQDDLVTELAGHLGVTVQRLEMERALKKPGDLTAWEATTRALAALARSDEAGMDAGIADAARAISIAPDYGNAHATLAQLLYMKGMLKLDSHLLREALDSSARAIALEPNNPSVLWKAARIYLQPGSYDQALVFAQRAVKLAPYAAHSYSALGTVLMHIGRHSEGLIALAEAQRLAPDSHANHLALLLRATALQIMNNLEDGLVGNYPPPCQACAGVIHTVHESRGT